MKARGNKVGILTLWKQPFVYSVPFIAVDTTSEGVLLMKVIDSLIYFHNGFSTINFF